MNAARDYVDDMIFAHAQILPPEWVVDLRLSADELERFANDSLFAYRTMTEMEASARRSGDITKADYLRGALNNIDVKSYYAYQKATENAQALRDAARNSRLPETVDRAALLDALEDKIKPPTPRSRKLLKGGVDTLDPAVKEPMYILEQKMNLYWTVRDAVQAGRDPVLYLDECVRLAADASDVSLAQFAAMMETQAELMEMFSNLALGFPVDVGGLRSALGVDDFDMASAVTELSARIEVYGFDSTPGTTVLLDAFDRANGRALAQLEDLPDEYLARAGLADDSGTLSADVRRAIQDDPESAYRILTKMEADARARSLELLDEGAGQEALQQALEMADYLAAVIAVLDREAMSGFERALEAAEALRAADNIRLANDVDQPVMVRVIHGRLAALDARRVTLDLNDANALAQLEAEYAFLTGALRRVEEGYDPGPRLCEMVLIAQDRVIEMVLIEHDRVIWRGGDASELANIDAAYRNVLEVLDGYPVSVVGMPSIDDVRPPGVGASFPPGYPGKELTDDSDLGRINLSLLGSSEGARNLALFTDTQDAVHFDTARANLRRQLDIALHQLSLENPIRIDLLAPPPPKRPK